MSNSLWLHELLHASLPYVKSLQSCPTLCDPIDGSPPGSPVPGILQARTLEWVAISFSNAWKWKVKVKSFSCVRLFATPWTAAYQAPPSMGFSRQEYWSGVPSPSPRRRLCLGNSESGYNAFHQLGSKRTGSSRHLKTWRKSIQLPEPFSAKTPITWATMACSKIRKYASGAGASGMREQM